MAEIQPLGRVGSCVGPADFAQPGDARWSTSPRLDRTENMPDSLRLGALRIRPKGQILDPRGDDDPRCARRDLDAEFSSIYDPLHRGFLVVVVLDGLSTIAEKCRIPGGAMKRLAHSYWLLAVLFGVSIASTVLQWNRHRRVASPLRSCAWLSLRSACIGHERGMSF